MKFIIADTDKKGKGTKQYSNLNQNKNDPEYCYYNILYPSSKVQCDTCKRDISKLTKILTDENDYCVACFSNLDQYPQMYRVITKIDFPLLQVDWSAEEELLLFEGLEKHGFGNWSQIVDFIATDKSREDVQTHYTTIYITNEEFLPIRQILSKRDPVTLQLIFAPNLNHAKRIQKQNQPAQQNKYQHQRGSLTVNSQHYSSLKSNANAAEIVGYMPKRGDFEVQYDNDAELLLAQMEFNDDDNEQQKEMKFKLMEIYNHKLSQRKQRKQFVISRRLLDLKQQSRLEKNRSKQQKQIFNMVKVFERFNNPENHEKLVSGIMKEKQIRQRIEQLKQFKKKGFRTLAQVQEELEAKRKRQQKVKSKKQEDANYFIKDKNTRRSRHQAPVERSEKRLTNLTLDEENLCSKFSISQRQYATIKDHILRQSVKQGILQKDNMTKLFKIQRKIVEGIFDFLVEKQDIIQV